MAEESIEVVAGFSLLNRWLLYASFMLAPAQFMAGWESNGPVNLGFLAYNWYNQFVWYFAVRDRELHALSLLPIHFNFIYAFSYLGGVSSGNIVMGLLAGLGTGGVMVLNTVAAWTSWATNQPQGYGEYQFFFFGWRTLNDGWHKFLLCWQIGDSFLALSTVIGAIAIPITMFVQRDRTKEQAKTPLDAIKAISNLRYPLIPIGAAVMLLLGWPLIMWVELIVNRNHITSPTDWVSVWLFVAQVGLLMIPSLNGYLGYLVKRCFGKT
jgi:hypothetical protein